MAEVQAPEAARWLNRAGLLADRAGGFPLLDLLRAGRIVGQEQRPNTKNGTRFIRRLAESSDAHAIPQARDQMRKYQPIDTHRPEHSPSRLAALEGNPDFWQELGKTLAAFG